MWTTRHTITDFFIRTTHQPTSQPLLARSGSRKHEFFVYVLAGLGLLLYGLFRPIEDCVEQAASVESHATAAGLHYDVVCGWAGCLIV